MRASEGRMFFQLVSAAWASKRMQMADSDFKAMMASYMAGLDDLDFQTVSRAIDRLVKTSEWIPSVAAIREAAGVVIYGSQVTGAEAWWEVHTAMGTYGYTRTPGVDFQFKDPKTAIVVKALGWQHLCRSEQDALVHYRARFIDAYEAIVDRERKNAAVAPGMVNPMLQPSGAPAPRELAAPAPILTADARASSLREVLVEALARNPHLAPELQSITDSVGDLDIEIKSPAQMYDARVLDAAERSFAELHGPFESRTALRNAMSTHYVSCCEICNKPQEH